MVILLLFRFNISQMVVKLGHQCPNHPVYNYYLTKKAEGKHYYESLTACSTKILRMLYTMCKNNTTFNKLLYKASILFSLTI